MLRVFDRCMHMLSAWPRWLVIGGAIAMIVTLGFLDYATGTELNIAVLFIVPIVAVTWTAGARWTAPLALLSGMTMFAANHAAGIQYTSPLIPLWNFGSRFVVFMIVARVVVQLRRAATIAETLARTDALTGVGNVRSFRESAENEIARAERYHHPFTVVFLDIDDFKRVNDSLGHEAGDRTLRAIGQALVRHVRKTDVVARIGGDEFVVLLPMMPARDAERFLSAFRNRLRRELEGSLGQLTCSMGAVTFETPPGSVDEILKLADERRYDAKQSGKDTIRHRVIRRELDVGPIAPEAVRLSA